MSSLMGDTSGTLGIALKEAGGGGAAKFGLGFNQSEVLLSVVTMTSIIVEGLKIMAAEFRAGAVVRHDIPPAYGGSVHCSSTSRVSRLVHPDDEYHYVQGISELLVQ